MTTRRGLGACAFILLMTLFTNPSVTRADIRFNRDIRSILSENCLGCHGPDAEHRKGKLRLDRREDATKPAESGDIAIVPGQPEKSALIERINTTDRTDLMPPPKSHKALTNKQREL
ncbi:MAG: c-type cytochrome domain-containing protein, partial [Verrucomicrobiota bacterium]